jgi:2-C-methyl-D-erythritol 4-phosphate cytidylyltransferase
VGGPVYAIVAAGGSGQRFGGPKQFALVGGRRVLDRSVEAARSVATGVVLVVPASSVDDPGCRELADVVVAGGVTRADSVRCGLAAVPDDVAVIVVHDAARPLASPALFRAVVDAVLAGADGAVPALPVRDTVKRVRSGIVVDTLDRAELMAVQTPQAFRAEALRQAHAGAADGTDDACLVERDGRTVVVVPGEPRNIKLTSADDVALLEAWVAG